MNLVVSTYRALQVTTFVSCWNSSHPEKYVDSWLSRGYHITSNTESDVNCRRYPTAFSHGTHAYWYSVCKWLWLYWRHHTANR